MNNNSKFWVQQGSDLFYIDVSVPPETGDLVILLSHEHEVMGTQVFKESHSNESVLGRVIATGLSRSN